MIKVERFKKYLYKENDKRTVYRFENDYAVFIEHIKPFGVALIKYINKDRWVIVSETYTPKELSFKFNKQHKEGYTFLVDNIADLSIFLEIVKKIR